MRAAEPAPDGAAQPTVATQQHPFTAKLVLCRAHAVCCTTERHCAALHCTALHCTALRKAKQGTLLRYLGLAVCVGRDRQWLL